MVFKTVNIRQQRIMVPEEKGTMEVSPVTAPADCLGTYPYREEAHRWGLACSERRRGAELGETRELELQGQSVRKVRALRGVQRVPFD